MKPRDEFKTPQTPSVPAPSGGGLYEAMPSSPEAEQSALAAILARPERMEEAATELSPSHFHAPDHRAIYAAMLALKAQGRGVELLTVADSLERVGKLAEIGGTVRLAEIMASGGGSFSETVRLLREVATRREIIEASLALMEGARNPMRDVSALVEKAHQIGTGAKRPGQPSRAFTFLGLEELLGTPRPTKWLIRDYLEAETLSVLFGESGCMKTFVALDMGLCVASGTDWHGNKVPNPGPVFYLAGEGFNGIGKRIKAWIVSRGADPAGLPFFVSSAPAQFLDGESAAAVAGAVASLAEQHGPPRLVIVDTLNRNFGPGDENSSADMTAFVSALDDLKSRFGCAVMVVHHSGLSTGDRSRGSSVLKAASDFEYKLAVRGGVRVLRCTKSKDHEPPATLAFEPEEVGTGWTDYESEALPEIMSCVLRLTDVPEASDIPKPSGAKRIALDALREACEAAGGPVHPDEWRRVVYSRGISKSDNANAQRQAFFKAKKGLESDGLVRETDGLWMPTQSVTSVTNRYEVTPVTGGQSVTTVTPLFRGGNGVTPPGNVTHLGTPFEGNGLENPFSGGVQ